MKENLIGKVIQARKIEATKKQINPKLIMIAKTFGSPIIGQYTETPVPDWTNFNDPENDWSQIDNADDGTLPRLGYIFDSLRSGVNIEIVVMAREVYNPVTGKKEMERPTEVRCNYNGYKVYQELEGNLHCYSPFPEWENFIDKIHSQSLHKDRQLQEIEREKQKKIKKIATKKTLQAIRMLWGI